MTGDLERHLREDRALRDAALALFRADLAHVKADLANRGVGARIADRMGEGAADVFEEAVEVADSHKGALATLVAAIVLWFARHPIMSLFLDDDEAGDENREPEQA